jgi:uncharacterized membrane protein
MLKHISRAELLHAQIILFVAILLQIFVWSINDQLALLPQYFIVAEIVMSVLLGFTANTTTAHARKLHHISALLLIGLISAANFSSLVYIIDSLVFGHAVLTGPELLISAMAIFATNIIVYTIWYWEIDSPGLTRTKWSKNDKDFQFTQQDMKKDYPGWEPEFFDYLYLSITNAVNFAPADTKPLTRQAKLLMASQALISVTTLALVIARSVSILGS